MKREYLFAGLVVIIVALSVAWGQVRTTEAKLSDLRWGSNAPQFIIENSAKKNQFTGPLLIKLTSGKDQFISGDWKLAFSGSEIYGFGNFAKSTSTADTNSTSTSIFSPHTGPYLMRIADDTINIIEEKDLGAPIAEGSHSLNNSYFGVRLQNDRHTFCVIELTEDRKDHPCQSVPIEKDDQVMWSPTTDHQLIVQSATGTVTTIDVWDGKEMKKTEPATANLRYQYHRNIAEIQTKPALEMHRYWDILAVKQPNGWKAFHIPSGSHATLLSDNNHLLITEKNSLSILEISTRKIAHLYADNGIGDAQISTRNSNEISL